MAADVVLVLDVIESVERPSSYVTNGVTLHLRLAVECGTQFDIRHLVHNQIVPWRTFRRWADEFRVVLGRDLSRNANKFDALLLVVIVFPPSDG